MQAEVNITATTLAEFLQQITACFDDKPALVQRSGLRDELWSYRRLNIAAHNVARQLLEQYALQPGDRILIHGFNGPQWVAVYLGCMIAGVIVVPLDRSSSADFIARVAALVEAAAMISDESQSSPETVKQIGIADFDMSAEAGESLPFSPKPDDIAEIMFTSGTTGQPKGVILTHRNILASVKAIQNVYPQRSTVSFLSLLPLSHMFEQCAGLFAPLLHGATIYYPDGRHSLAILQKLVKKRIHGVIAVPQILELLLHSIESNVAGSGRAALWRAWPAAARHLPFAWRRRFTNRLFPQAASLPKFFVCGGAPLPAVLEQHLENLGIRVVQGYGATECAPVIASNDFDKRIVGAVGWPAPGVELKLSDEGEILVRGENVTQGYWRNPAATRAAFTDEHFYRTADFGEIGKQGEVYIRGRCNDGIVLANGMNVFPEDIEAVLRVQPGIDACIVLSLPDSDGAPCIAAALRLKQDISDAAEKAKAADAAVRLANDKLASHQRIAVVRVWDGDFPRTPLLKVQRWKIREKLIEEQTLQTHDAADVHQLGKLATLEQLLANVSNVPVDTITDATDLAFDLGLDSLRRVELTVSIEQQLGVHVDDADLVGIRSVAELKALLKRSESVAAAPAFPVWPLSAEASAVRRWLQSTAVLPAHRLLSRSFSVEGLENLRDLAQPALFIANHSSHVDTLSVLRALPAAIRNKLAVAAAADYFFRYRLLAAAMGLAVNAFPFSREGSIRASLEYCGELMDNGWSVLIYPEGTRSPTGELLDFKPGIGFLATGLDVPIVPIAVYGGYQILPKGACWLRRGDVRVVFGKPLRVAPGSDKQEATRFLHETLSQLLHGEREQHADRQPFEELRPPDRSGA